MNELYWKSREEVRFAPAAVTTETWTFPAIYRDEYHAWRKANPRATLHEMRQWVRDHHGEIEQPVAGTGA